MNSEAVAIIPARMASTRFPGKMLADKTGFPLIRHVWEAAKKATCLSRICVATDDERIRAAVGAFGGEVVMTSPEHPNGTSRLAEAARLLGLRDEALIVNVQGDEPELEAGVIDAAVETARGSGAEVATVASPLSDGEDAADPNIVKVVLRADGSALYFSRAAIPYPRDGSAVATPLRHVGVYVYRAGFLQDYVRLVPTPLERTEVLEQLRVLEHGHRIVVAVRQCTSQGIDTPGQYEQFVERWKRAHPAR